MKVLFAIFLLVICCTNLSAQNRGLNFDGVDDFVTINNNTAPRLL